ncbi:hypothetical protein NQ314_017079 [Rhamnusium bicolor]|uniref:Zinc finger PHD-type domain-containing protein n=1 Tax=Rhamnusium bicolor TaxID=1586634 RepID=A0AAV8WU63_9CUCU|nr:hypothetical protein NQ314_017079 [Rhamnusium bicolor]
MKKAISEVVSNRSSVNAAAKKYDIPEPTLRRYLKKGGRTRELEEHEFPVNAGRYKKTFSTGQIEELKQYIVDIDRRAFGLTKSQFGRLCFDFAESKGITHKFNKDKRAAGRDFIEAFMKESKLTLRKPEATSVARLMAFNKINVGKFFDVLKDLRIAHSFQAANIYNADETGFSTVPTRTPKVISPIGNRRVIKLKSAERGTTVTSVKRMNPSFMVGAPPGSEGVAHESGWMTAEKFINYLHHFAKFAHPRKDNPVLMIMDNHASHVTLEAIQYCRDNLIFLLGLPAHTSHKLQPLDVAFYSPLKNAYNSCCDDFMVNNPGCTISIRELASIAGKAYLQVANARTAIKAFEATGIEPFNQAIFNEEDFAPAQTTDMPIQTVESDAFPTSAEPQVIRSTDIPSELVENVTVSTSADSQAITSTDTPSELVATVSTSAEPQPTSSGLPPLPTARTNTSRRPRKKLPSMHLTSTPVKEALVERKMEKDEKEEKRKQRLMNKDKKKTKTQKMKKVAQQKKKKTVRQVFSSSDDSDSIEVQYVNTDDDMDPENEEEQDCIICGEQGKNELWYQCVNCKLWAHAACSGWDENEAKHCPWKCDFCM